MNPQVELIIQQIKATNAECRRLKTALARCMEALKFYASARRLIIEDAEGQTRQDDGAMARAALAKLK